MKTTKSITITEAEFIDVASEVTADFLKHLYEKKDDVEEVIDLLKFGALMAALTSKLFDEKEDK